MGNNCGCPLLGTLSFCTKMACIHTEKIISPHCQRCNEGYTLMNGECTKISQVITTTTTSIPNGIICGGKQCGRGWQCLYPPCPYPPPWVDLSTYCLPSCAPLLNCGGFGHCLRYNDGCNDCECGVWGS